MHEAPGSIPGTSSLEAALLSLWRAQEEGPLPYSGGESTGLPVLQLYSILLCLGHALGYTKTKTNHWAKIRQTSESWKNKSPLFRLKYA